jgi:argininosuccinate synthase
VLHIAHRALESITLDREVMHIRDTLIPKYAQLVYNGFWFSPERTMLQPPLTRRSAMSQGLSGSSSTKGIVSWWAANPARSLYRNDFVTFEADQSTISMTPKGSFALTGCA